MKNCFRYQKSPFSHTGHTIVTYNCDCETYYNKGLQPKVTTVTNIYRVKITTYYYIG